MGTYSPNKAECEAAQGLADLKEYCISEPISIPKPSSTCTTSSMSGMATPNSIDNIESTNLNHNNNEEVSVEENRLLFSKFKISGASPFVDCQQLQPISQVLAKIPSADSSLSTLAPILQSQQPIDSIPIQCLPVNNNNNILTMEPNVTILSPQRVNLLNEEDHQRRMNMQQYQRAKYEANQRKLHQQQVQRQYCIHQHQLQHQHAQWDQCVSNQRHAQFLGSYPPVQRSQSVIAYPVNQNQTIHNRRRQTLSTLGPISHVPQNISLYPHHQQQLLLQPNHGPLMPIQSTSLQQVIVQDRAAVRQQRHQMEEQEFNSCNDMSGSLTSCNNGDISTYSATVVKHESPEAGVEDMDEDYDGEDGGYLNTITSKRKLSAKVGKEKPRWTIDMRKKLFRVVIAQKKLADMATFDWDGIGRQVGRPGKACKDQWRRALLPKLEQSFEHYSHNNQYSPSDE